MPAESSELTMAATHGDASSPRQFRRGDLAPRFVGGKGGEGVWQNIINQMPPHAHYLEAFAGTGIVARMKRPALRTTLIDLDPAAPALAMAATMPGGTAIVGDAVQHLREWRGELPASALVYCDPPYLMEVRSSKRRYYRHEMFGEGEHVDLLWLLRSLPCRVIVSGYWSKIYGQVLEDWRTVRIPTVNRRGRRVTEWLWCNFPEPAELHDFRWLGNTFRERERVRRKRNRIIGKLLRLPVVELAAVLAEMGERGRRASPSPPPP
jgi:DNA adenine methylase